MRLSRPCFGVAIACCGYLLTGCGGGTESASEPAASAPSAAPVTDPQAQNVAAADWPSYNRTLAGDRFSPLAEIDRGNVAQLGVACTYTLPEVSALQAGPIVVDGTMYFTTERNSYSIDAATCAEKWRVEYQSSRPSPLGVQRGFAYLDGRLFRGTSDAHVLALDAADGHTLWDVDDGRGGDAGRLDADGADRRERPGLHRQRGRRPDRRHRSRVRARRARRPRRLAFRRGARRARRASDLAERGPLSDHGRRVLDVVRARRANAACSTCRRATPRPTSTWKRAAATTCTRTR